MQCSVCRNKIQCPYTSLRGKLFCMFFTNKNKELVARGVVDFMFMVMYDQLPSDIQKRVQKIIEGKISRFGVSFEEIVQQYADIEKTYQEWLFREKYA